MPPIVRTALGAVFVLAGLATSGPARADAREAVLAAHRTSMESRVRIEMDTAGGGRAARSTVRYDTSRRVHMKTDQMELVMLPEGTWMRTGGEAWTQPPFDVGSLVRQLVPQTVEQVQSGISNAVAEGAAEFGGQAVQAYRFDVAVTVMGVPMTSRNRILVDGAGRIVHSVSDGEALGRKTHAEQTYHYDEAIRITAPH